MIFVSPTQTFYLQDAIESFNDWFELYHRGKPTPPESPEGGNFTERMAYDHHMKLYEAEFDHWRHGLELQTKVSSFLLDFHHFCHFSFVFFLLFLLFFFFFCLFFLCAFVSFILIPILKLSYVSYSVEG